MGKVQVTAHFKPCANNCSTALKICNIMHYFLLNVNYRQNNLYRSCFAAAIARNRPRLVKKLVLISGGAPVPLYPQEGCLNSMPLCCLYICRENIQSTFRK